MLDKEGKKTRRKRGTRKDRFWESEPDYNTETANVCKHSIKFPSGDGWARDKHSESRGRKGDKGIGLNY